MKATKRVLLKVLCKKKHLMAEVVPRAEGPTLKVTQVRLFDTDPSAKLGYTAGKGGDASERLLLDDPVFRSDSLIIVCPQCHNDYRLDPREVAAHMKKGKAPMELEPRRARTSTK